MINNYRSRSFSFKTFKQARTGASLPHSAIFTPASKKTTSSPDSYLSISYASPHQYYTNHGKNCGAARLECHLPISHSASIRRKRFPSSIFEKEQEKQEKEEAEEGLFQRQQRQRCLYNYFASLARHEEEGRAAEREEREQRPKSKSILLIRKIHKRKEEAAARARERLEEEFRNRKQVPIHHTQFHFHKQRKSRTEQSPSHTQQRAEFNQKIHRAVEEILRLRATLNNQHPLEGPAYEPQQKQFRGIIIEGGNFRPPPAKLPLPLTTKSPKFPRKRMAKKTAGAAEENEIGPWVRTSNDVQFLF